MNTNNKLQAVLFDVDGTLADTEQDGHRLAFNAAFKQFHLDWNWDIDLYGELLQITGGKERIRYFMERYAPAELDKSNLTEWIASLHKTKTKHFESLMSTAPRSTRLSASDLAVRIPRAEMRSRTRRSRDST